MMYPLHLRLILKASVTAGAAIYATENRKLLYNGHTYEALGWECLVDSFGAWGDRATKTFSRLASRLATQTRLSNATVCPICIAS